MPKKIVISGLNKFFLLSVVPFVGSLWIAAAMRHFIDLPSWMHNAMTCTSMTGVIFAWAQFANKLDYKRESNIFASIASALAMLLSWSFVVWW